MNSEANQGGKPQMEDYGSPSTDDNQINGSQTEDTGKYSGGTQGTRQGSSENEQFGEYANTGLGTDLTVEMENTDLHTGMVKGGEAGADDAAGPGQYGGAAGDIKSHGHFGGDISNLSEKPQS